jgi:integrase
MKGDTTIRASLFKSKTLANGEHPLMLVITQNRKRKYVSLGHSCLAKYWNFDKEEPKISHPDRQLILHLINTKVGELQRTVLEHKAFEMPMSADILVEGLLKARETTELLDFIESIIEQKKTQNKIGNANVYADLLRVLKRFLPTNRTLLFEEVDHAFLNKLETHFRSRNLTESSMSVYFRTLKAVFNKARNEGVIPETLYPFGKFKTTKFNTETRKRAITKVEINQVRDFDASASTKLQLAKDIFMFSYYCQGINIADIAHLKWMNISNDRLYYKRMKTKKEFSIRLIEPALAILEQYKPVTLGAMEDYIFPILERTFHLSPQQKDYRIQKVTGQSNKYLKEIGLHLRFDFPLTTYVARHSFATVLMNAGVSVSKISQAMGHKSESITYTYLKSFENAEIDEILDKLV